MKDELDSKKIIGLMSGTSCDSIDAGLCIVHPDLSCELVQGINYKYPPHIREKIFNLFSGNATVKDVCQMNFAIGKCFANACNILISEHGKPDFIASHGQTIYHYPFDEKLDDISLKSTLQIGESSVIAKETGCHVISNFREADIANGGEGAPLVCFADEKWFKPLKKNIAIQNIGGISNVTVISQEKPTFGFDTGLGNIMIDYCMNKFFNKPFDENGDVANSGKIQESWLDCLMQDDYYFKNPPKSTGREYFSTAYIENALKFGPKVPEDIIATVTALTAKTIAKAYERFVYPDIDIQEVVVGGGGAYNTALMKFLRHYLPKHIDLKTHEAYGISNNFKEVMAFALLGYCNYYGIPNNLPECTGAHRRVILGKVAN
ncbi:anhydro-N-acetylmuramic acid kinase [Spirochaetes bacterium]|uniref:Anhydro-N-acetylmuramic acid kinase n=1 Tax=Candidatus Scatousia excrementipullorum TaxID=2840936 RepID=A0A9D9GZN9_9BACT|nr:anhydro-N-acetylmuramic acid kinase [Candidatus Scatousia excrementipullorum]